MIQDPRQDTFDLADQKNIFRQLTKPDQPQSPYSHRGERDYASFKESLAIDANVGSISFARAEAVAEQASEARIYGQMKDSVQRAEQLGHTNPKNAQDLYDFNFKIESVDGLGNRKIEDSRTLGWANASEASFFMANQETQRGITSRNAASKGINKSLMFGGAREYFEDRGLTKRETPYDEAVKRIDVASGGFNMDPRNWATSFDLFGAIDNSPDIQALKWEDPSFNGKEYLNELNAIKPEYTSFLLRNGVDIEVLKKTTNANEFWMQINKQQALVAAAATIATWKDSVPEYQEWAMLTKDFIRDSLINDPDFAGELVISGAIALASVGTAIPGLVTLGLARKAKRGVKVAEMMLETSKMLKKVAQKANNALPQNWGLTFGNAIRNTKVGKFLNVTSDDFLVDGVRFGKTRKYGSKLVGYTFSEVPAGFIEEGIAGAYNAYTINQLDQTQDRSLFDSFVQEGIQGSLIRAFGINPALRGLNFGMRYTGSKVGKIALDNIGFLGGEGGWAQTLGGAFLEARNFLSLDNVGFLDNEIDTLQLVAELQKLNMTDADYTASLEGTTMQQLVNEHPALVAIAEMLRFDQQGAIIGRNPETGKLKIVELVQQARREVARARVFAAEGIKDADLNLDPVEGDTEAETARKEKLNKAIDEEVKRGSVTNDEINLAMLHTFWGKLDSDARDSYEAQQMRNMAYFKVQLRSLAIEKMREEAKKGNKITIEEAQRSVLQDPELLLKIDQGGIAAELDQLIAKQHPELFDERLVYNEETGEQSIVYVPKSMIVDEDGTVMAGDAITELLNNIRRNVNFDTQRAAIMNHRKKLGMVKDVRFAIDEALAARTQQIFGELQAKISHGKNFKRVQNFVKQEYNAVQKGTVITRADGTRGTLTDVDDADVIIIQTTIRGTKVSGQLQFKGHEYAHPGGRGQKVVTVVINSHTVEHAETFRNFLNSLEVIDKLEISKIENGVRPLIRDSLEKALNLDKLSDAQLDEVYGALLGGRPDLRTPEAQETREGFPITEEPMARSLRRGEKIDEILDSLSGIITVRAVAQFESAAEVQTSMLERVNALVGFDEARIASIVATFERTQFGRDFLDNVYNVFGISVKAEGLPLGPTSQASGATNKLRDAMGVPRDEGPTPPPPPAPPTKDDAEPAAEDDVDSGDDSEPIGPQPFIGPPKPRVGKPSTTPPTTTDKPPAATREETDEEPTPLDAAMDLGSELQTRREQGEIEYDDLTDAEQNLLDEYNSYVVATSAKNKTARNFTKMQQDLIAAYDALIAERQKQDTTDPEQTGQNASQLDNALENSASTTTSDAGDQLGDAVQQANTGEIATEKGETVSGDLAKAAELRRQIQEIQDRITARNANLDSTGQRVVNNAFTRINEIMDEMNALAAERKRMADDESFTGESEEYNANLEKAEKLLKEMQELEEAAAKSQVRNTANNKEENEADLKELERLKDELAKLAPDTSFTVTEELWAQVEVARMKQQMYAKAHRAMMKLFDEAKGDKPTLASIQGALATAGIYKKKSDIAKGFLEKINAKLVEQKKDKLTNYSDDTSLNKNLFADIYKSYAKDLLRVGKQPLTRDELAQASVMAKIGKAKWNDLSDMDAADAIAAAQIDGSGDPINITEKPFVGVLREAFDPRNRLTGEEMTDEEKESALSIENNLELVKTLQNSLINVYNTLNRKYVTAAELASFALGTTTRKGDVNVGALYARLNFDKVFSESLRPGDANRSVQYFDIDSLLNELDLHQARLEFAYPTKKGGTQGQRKTMRKIEAARLLLEKDQAVADPELLIEEVIELAEGDADVLRQVGQELFQNGSTKGQYLLGINTNGGIETNTDGNQYTARVESAILTRLNGYRTNRVYVKNIIDELIRSEIISESFRDVKILDDALVQEVKGYIVSYLLRYPGNTSNSLTAWGNGEVSYSFADQVGMGVVDTLAMTREGTDHETVESFQDEFKDNRLMISPDRLKEGKDPNKYRGAPLRINMAEPMTAGRLQRLREDHRLMRIQQFVLELDLNPDQVTQVLDWAESDKEATEVVAGANKFIAGERPMPRFLVAGPGDRLKEPKDVVDDMLLTMSNIDQVLQSTIHDAFNIQTNGVQPNGGFIDEGAFREVAEKLGMKADGLARVLSQREGAGAGAYGGLASGITSFGSEAYHFNRGWEALFPIFRDAAIDSVASWEALNQAIANNPDVEIKSLRDILSKETYFDGNFNGIHHKMALFFQWTNKEVFNGATREEIKAAIEGEGDAYDQFLAKQMERINEEFKSISGQDYYAKVAHDVITKLLREAYTGQGANKDAAAKTVEVMKEKGLLPVELNSKNYKEIITVENIGDESNADLNILRKLFKKPVMTYLYGSGFDTINKNFVDFMVDDLKLTSLEAAEISEPLTFIAHGFGAKERAAAMTELSRAAQPDSPLYEIIGGRAQMDTILKAMQKRMDDRGFSAQAITTVNDSLRNAMGVEDLDVIQYNHIAFQIQARQIMVEDLIQVRLGYEPGTPKYKAMKQKINNMLEAAAEVQSKALRKRIANGLDSISGKDPTGERPGFTAKDAERKEFIDAIEVILTKDKKLWKDLIPDFVTEVKDAKGNPVTVLKDKTVGKTLGKENIGSILRLIRNEVSQPITKSEAREAQDAAQKASGIEDGLFKAVKALNQVARKPDMQSLEDLMEFMGVSMLEPSMRETLSKFYSENESYRGMGQDLYSGRQYNTEAEGSSQGPKGAQDKGQSASEPLLAMGAMVKTRVDMTKTKARQMFARYILGRSANVKTDSDHIIIQLAKEAGREDIVALLTEEDKLTDKQRTERDTQFVKQWLEEYKKLKDIEKTFRQRTNGTGVLDSGSDPNGILAQQIKLSAGLQAATTGVLDPTESQPSESIEELIERQIKVGVNHGMFASRAQIFDTSFRNLGVPELKAARNRRKLGLTSKQKLADLKEFQEDYTPFSTDEARLVKEEFVTNILENSYKTDADSLLFDHREPLMETGLRARVGERTIQRVSFRLENSLTNFAVENGLVHLVRKNDWQTLDYMRQAFIIREKNARFQAAEIQAINADTSKPDDLKTREIEGRMHFWRRMTNLQIKAINQRKIDNSEARSYTTELTPAGNMGIVTKKILFDKDGRDRPIGQVLAALSNDLNNLQSMGAFAIIPGVAFSERTRGSFDLSESRDQPRVVHAHDVAHILTSLYDKQITKEYLGKTNKKYTQELIDRKGLVGPDGEPMTVDYFVENLTTTGMELTLFEVAEVIDGIESTNRTLAETVVLSQVSEAIMGRTNEKEATAALNNTTRRSVVQGLGKVQEEQKVVGTTARFRLTLRQAKDALLALRNAPVLDAVSDVRYTGISGINRPRAKSTRFEVDHVTGQRVNDIRLNDELHAEALQAIIDRNHIRTTGKADLPTKAGIDTVVGGRDRSNLQKLERRNRRLPKLVRIGKRQEQSIYVDYTAQEAKTLSGKDLYNLGYDAFIAALQKNKIDMTSTERKALSNLVGKSSLATDQNRKLVLGYLLQHFEPHGIQIDGFDSVQIAVAMAYINLDLGGKTNEGFTTLREVLAQEKVQQTAKLMTEILTLNHTIITGESNPFFYDARGFVANLNTSRPDIDADSEVFDVFQQYLQEQIGDEYDITNADDVALARKALKEALTSTRHHVENFDFSDKTVLQIPTEDEVTAGFMLNPATALLKNHLDTAVEQGHMSSATRDIVFTVIGRMAALNPELLHNVKFNIARDTEGNIVTESRAMTIPKEDSFLVELSGRDAKKAPLEAAKILIHEIIHVGTFKYYDLESNAGELGEITALMGKQSVSRLTYRLTKAMHGEFSDGEALARHRHYNNNPEEFIAETAAMYFMSEASEEIDLILKEEAQRAERTDVETTEKQTFIQKFTKAFTNMLQNARVQINQMAALLKQYSKQEKYRESFEIMQKLSYRAAGIVVKDGRLDATLIQKKNIQSYTRHHEESEIPTNESISDKEFLELLSKKEQLENQLKEDPDETPFGAPLSEAERSEIIEEIIKIEEIVDRNNTTDDFEVQRKVRIQAEQLLLDSVEVGKDGVPRANIKDMLKETPAIAMSIMINNLRINKGDIHRTVLERLALSQTGRIALGTATDPSQTNSTIDSVFDLVQRLALVIDSQALMTEHMVSGEGGHDLLRAKQQVDNDMAFLKGKLRNLAPEQHATVLEYVSDATLAPRAGEEAAHKIATLVRNSMQNLIKIAKDSGILYEGLEYHSTPIKINEQNLARNEAGVLTHMSELIGNKILTQMRNNNLDPLTLMNSGILPPLLITDKSANIDKLSIKDKDRFIEHMVELAQTDEGIAAIEDIMGEDFLPVGSRKALEGLSPSDIANYTKGVTASDAWTADQILMLQYGLRNLFRKGLQRQGLRRNVDGIIALVKSRSVEYQAAINKPFDGRDIEVFRANKDFNIVTRPAMNQTETTIREEFKHANNPALFRARMFLGEVQTGARFLAVDKNFDPNPKELMSKSRGDVDASVSNPLYGVFVTDPNVLFESVSTGLGFDAVASEALGNAMGTSQYQITGIRFDDVLAALLETGSEQIVKDPKAAEGLKASVRGKLTTSRLREDLEILQDKYNQLAGRRMRVDPTKGGKIQNMLGTAGSDMVLALYGGNLTMATSIVEGTISGLAMMGRGDMLLGPARLVGDIIKGALAGSVGGLGRGIGEVTGGKLGKSLDFETKNSLTELAFAHQHATLRGLEASETEGSLITDSTITKIGKNLGNLARGMAKASTGASGGVQNNIKFHIEGMAINTLDRLIKSGAIFKLSKFLADPDNADLLTLDTDDGKFTILHKKIKKVLRNSGVQDFNFLGKQDVKIVIALMESGAFKPEFLDNLNELMQKTGLGEYVVDGSRKKYDPEFSPLSKISAMQETALLEPDPTKRKLYNDTLSVIKEYVNREIEARFVGGNPLYADTNNSGLSVLTKIFKSYPTLFFNQRLRHDMRYYSPMQNATRIMALMALDIAYMVALEFIKSGFEEDRLDQLLEEMQRTDSLARLLSRTPTFGMWGGILASGITETVIAVSGKKGYTQNLFNQAFMPVPMTKLGSMYQNVIALGKYGFSDDPMKQARFNLALLNLATGLPLLQEGFIKSAAMHYLTDDDMDAILLQNMRKRSGTGGGNSRGSVGRYFENPNDPLNNPGMPEYAAARNIWPDELIHYDIMANLAHQPLRSLMGPPSLNQDKLMQEAMETQQPSQKAAPAPDKDPNPPRLATKPGLPTAEGSDASSRLAQALGDQP